LKEKLYKVTIKNLGSKGLMHNRFPIEDYNESKKKRKRAFNPVEDALKSLYKDEEGRIYQPANHIKKSLVRSAVEFPWKGRKTYKTLVESDIEVFPEKIYFEIPENPETYRVAIHIVRNVNTGGRQPKARPVWDKWQFTFNIKIWDSEEIDPKILKEMLVTAGRRYGIGTFRQEFGKFEITKFEEI